MMKYYSFTYISSAWNTTFWIDHVIITHNVYSLIHGFAVICKIQFNNGNNLASKEKNNASTNIKL